MPIYEFKDESTGQIEEHVMRVSALDSFKQSHGNLTQIHTSGNAFIDSARLGLKKPDQSFRELLKHVRTRAGGRKTRWE